MHVVPYEVITELDLDEELGEDRLIQSYRDRKEQWRRFGEWFKFVAPYVIPGGALLILIVFQNAVLSIVWLLATFAVRLWLEDVGLGKALHSAEIEPNMTDIARRAQKCGLVPANYVEPEVPPTYIKIAEDYPELACAGLRMELERRLRKLADLYGIRENRLCMVTAALHKRGIFTNDQHFVLSMLRKRLNSAVHGSMVEKGTEQWLCFLGPRLMARLDEVLQQRAAGAKTKVIGCQITQSPAPK